MAPPTNHGTHIRRRSNHTILRHTTHHARKNTMTEDYIVEDAYKGQLDAEGLLLMHMNRIAVYRDTDIRRYCSSIETLSIMCPRNIREKAILKINELGLQRGRYGSITEDKLVIYDDLLIYVNELLEKHHMIWKTKTVKIFE